MERGTDRERDAVRDQWRAMEARREAADRLLLGSVALFAGLSLLLVAVARETCLFTVGGATGECGAAPPQSTVLLFGLLGVLALGLGTRLCWTAGRA